MKPELLVVSYDTGVVLLSILVAAFASYAALDLARRVHEHKHWAAVLWVGAGAMVMGSGIWAMHFIGMLAMTLPIGFGFAPVTTLLSWLAAVGVSAVALGIAAHETLTARKLGGGALAMGAGICTMHYTGMAAMEMAPGIIWDWRWVAVSGAIACGASAVALVIFFGMRRLSGWRERAAQGVAALVMGLAISGMHYSGMAAAGFPAGALCLSADGLGGRSLSLLVLAAIVVLLSIALFVTALDSRMQARAMQLTRSLSDANAELQRLAFADALTGLPNRALFDDRLHHAVARVERSRARPLGTLRLALLFIDLDGFKPVNDSYGHAAGDQVLREVAARLRRVVREADTLARLGGDEFVLLIDDVTGVPDAVATAERILRALARSFDAGGRQVSLSGSIGVVVFPDHVDGERLLAAADAAMYAAKRAGGGTYAVFEPRMQDAAAEQLELLQDLRGAIGAGQLRLHYQPKVDSRSGQVRSVEALLRWQHPRLGLVSPALFVPLAERFGLIASIGAWVVDEACRQIARWGDEGRRLRVSINLSAYQLRQPDIVERIGAAIRHHALACDQLVCEITESAAMEDTPTTMRVLEGLAALGVKLSIDDFGTGYSSLSKLRRMHADELKIDREFVADVAHDADARAVVDAIVRLGHALGLRIVAEGVETSAQRDALAALGCDELQGFFFARPLPPEELLDDGEARRIVFSQSVLMHL